MTMLKRKPMNAVWPTRAIGKYPQVYVEEYYVRGARMIKLAFHEGPWDNGLAIALTRMEARLLARRLLQCLEATK